MNFMAAKGLDLTRHQKKIIDAVDIAIESTEFVGLIGPNGAGKSSLLRLLCGLLAPTRGEVMMARDASTHSKLKPLDAIKPARRAQFMAYLAQHETPAWSLSVENLVALGRIPWGKSEFSTASEQQIIADALRMTDVDTIAQESVSELSGGELQRVLLARVFAGQPQLILADEPIAALDLYHQLHVMELLQAHAQRGGAVMAALHDLSLAARFCSRLVLLHHGRIIAQGTPAQVLTPEHLLQVYGVKVHIDCSAQGVVIIPTERVHRP